MRPTICLAFTIVLLAGCRREPPETASAEREAREAKRGIWAGTFEDPAAWRKREGK